MLNTWQEQKTWGAVIACVSIWFFVAYDSRLAAVGVFAGLALFIVGRFRESSDRR